jgi:hypothetical protein
MSLSKRLDKLEAQIKPAGQWWERVTYGEQIEAWRLASEHGLYLDFATGRAVTLEELQTVDPVVFGRISEVENVIE